MNVMAATASIANKSLLLLRTYSHKMTSFETVFAGLKHTLCDSVTFVTELTRDVDGEHFAVFRHVVIFVAAITRNLIAPQDIMITSALNTSHGIASHWRRCTFAFGMRLIPELGQHILYVLCLIWLLAARCL